MIESTDLCSILAPISITSEMITSTNITPEDSNPAWVAGTTYGVGDRVYVATSHRVYESAKASNTGKDPTADANQFNAVGEVTWWIEVGPTNLYAMFDGLVSTKTSNTAEITVTIRPGYFNSFALFGIEADDISYTIKDSPGGNVIKTYSGPLEGSAPADYYEYFFYPFRPLKQFIVTDLDPYRNMEITISLTSPESVVKLGMLAIGDAKPIGAPLRGASVEPVDYSYVSTDSFGNTVVKKRSSATGLNINAKMRIEDAGFVLDVVKEFLGTPVVVIGSKTTMYEALTVFGLVSARQNYEDFGEPVINIKVKGLI